MNYISKLIALTAIVSAGLSNTMQALDSNGTGIGSISTEVNIALCTAIGGQATIEQGAFKETNNISSESANSDKKLDISVTGGQSACGDQVAGTYNPKTQKTTKSAISKTSMRSASINPAGAAPASRSSSTRTRSSAKKSIGDINQLSKSKYAALTKNAEEITAQGISSMLPEADSFKAFVIGSNDRDLLIKTSKGYANKYTITFYLKKPSASNQSVELMEIANIALKGITDNIDAVTLFLQAGQDGTVGIRILGVEQLLPTNVPLENFASFRASQN